MHGRVHVNPERYVIDLLVVDLHSSLAYLMMTHLAGKLPLTTVVARQLPTKLWLMHVAYMYIIQCMCVASLTS